MKVLNRKYSFFTFVRGETDALSHGEGWIVVSLGGESMRTDIVNGKSKRERQFERNRRKFEIYLRNKGMTDDGIKGYIRIVGKCQRILASAPVDGMSQDARERYLVDSLPNLSKSSQENYVNGLRHYERFLKILQSTNDGRERYILSERFRADLEDFAADLAQGHPDNTVVRHVRIARNICFMLAEQLGNYWPEEVGPEQVKAIEPCVTYGVETGRNYLRTFGRFISVVTEGPDPYRLWISPGEFQDAVSNIERIASENRFSDELTVFARILEENGMRDSTVRTSPRRAMACLRRLDEMGWEGELEDITPETVRYLRSTMTDIREETARGYLSCLGSMVEVFTGENPVKMANLHWNSGNVYTQKFISLDDWRKLIIIANPEERLILMLGGTMGLRRSEIANIMLDDISNGAITIRGKGVGPNGKEAVMKMPEAICDVLDQYLVFRDDIINKHGDRSDGRLMVRSAVHAGEPITPTRVSDIVESLGRRAGVDITTHSLRRFYATQLYRSGADLMTVKTLMRHKNLSTTDRYLKLSEDSLSNAVFNFQKAIFA